MGMSYGVGLCFDKKLTLKHLEADLGEALSAYSEIGVSFDVLSRGGLTLLAQGDGDHDRLWQHDASFSDLARRCAAFWKCRAWLVSGHAGTVSKLVVHAYDRNGKRTWAERNSKAQRRFCTDTKLDSAPFDFEVKPFFAIGPKWKKLGQLERFKTAAFAPATSDDLRRFLSAVPKGLKGFTSKTTSEDGVEIAQLFVQLDEKKVTLDTLGLATVGWRSPTFERTFRDDPVPLPDGKISPGRFNALRGLTSERKGKNVVLRWAFELTRAGHTFKNPSWVLLSRAEGALAVDFENFEGNDLAAQGEIVARAALEKDNARALLAAIDRYELDAEEWGEAARDGDAPKCFAAILKRLPAARADALRNRFVSAAGTATWGDDDGGADADVTQADWRGRTVLHNATTADQVELFVERGALLTATDEEGRTPLHVAEKPEVAIALVKAGASLEVKDDDGLTPVARFIQGLAYATPTDADVEVVLAFVNSGGKPVRKQVAALTRAWAKKKTHAPALKKVAGALAAAQG
ncbi:MAG: hypothetical protein QM817_07750 [Archangium sp.]